jgi:Thoeris protein ThsB, TIR-like domain
MKRRIFVSFVYEDRDQARGFTLLPYNRNVDFDFVETHLLKPADSENPDYIKQKIREKMDGISVSTVLIGKTTAKSPWVDFEIRESLARGKGVLGIKLKDCENAEVPLALKENGCKVINWDTSKFSEEIEKAALIAGRVPAEPPAAGGGSSRSCGR